MLRRILENSPIHNFLNQASKQASIHPLRFVINLTKHVARLYDEKFEILQKEMEGDTTGRKDLPHSWFGRISIVRMCILPKEIINLVQYSLKSQQDSSCAKTQLHRKYNLKINMEAKRPGTSKVILSKINNGRSTTIPRL